MKPDMVEQRDRWTRENQRSSFKATSPEATTLKSPDSTTNIEKKDSCFHDNHLFEDKHQERHCSLRRQSLPSLSSTYFKYDACQSSEVSEEGNFLAMALERKMVMPSQECIVSDVVSTLQGLVTPEQDVYPTRDQDLMTTKDKQEEVTHEYVWLKKVENSHIDYKIVKTIYNPCVMQQTTIEVKVKDDGRIVGTDCRLQDVLSDNDKNVVLKLDSSSPIVSFESLDGHMSYFYRLPDQQTQQVFDVVCFSSSSQKTSVIQGMTDHSWELLLEILSAAKHFLKAGESDVTLASEEQSEESISQSLESQQSGQDLPKKCLLVLSTTWLSIIRPLSKSLEIFSAFQSLPEADKDILRKQSTGEATVVRMIANYDKESNSRVYTGIKNHILVCTRTFSRVTKEIGEYRSFFESVNILMNEFDDKLRKDEVFMTILVVLSLLKEKPGVSRLDTINKGRRDFLDLLDKYIKAKIKSGEWTLSYNSMWNLIHRDIDRISNLRLLYENLKVNPAYYTQKSSTTSIK